MDSASTGRFTLGRQSSLAPDHADDHSAAADEVPPEINSNIRLMYLANEGNLEGIIDLLDSGVDVNFQDIDGRTALHVAACQGLADVVELLLKSGAKVDPEDRWGSTMQYTINNMMSSRFWRKMVPELRLLQCMLRMPVKFQNMR